MLMMLQYIMGWETEATFSKALKNYDASGTNNGYRSVYIIIFTPIIINWLLKK